MAEKVKDKFEVVRKNVLQKIRSRGMSLRLIVIQIVALLIMGLTLGAFNYVQVRQVLKKEITNRGVSLTKNQAYNARLGLITSDSQSLNTLLNGLKEEKLFNFAAIRNIEGEIIAGWGQLPDEDFLESVSSGRKEILYEPEGDDPTGLFIILAPVFSFTHLGNQSSEEDIFGASFEENQIESQKEAMVIGYCITGISPGYIKYPAEKALWANLWIVIGSILVLSVALSIVLTFSLRPMGKMAQMLKEIALGQGDLTRRLEFSSQDEIGTFGRWFNRFVKYLHEVVRALVITLRSVNDSFNDLAHESQPLLEGANEQISAVKDTGKSVEKMDLSISVIAENVEQLQKNTNWSADAISNMVQNIDAIDSSSETLMSRIENVNRSLGIMNPTLDQAAVNVQEIRQIGESVASAITQLNSAVENIKEQTVKSAEVSLNTRKLANKGQERINNTIGGIEDIALAFDEINSHMNELKKRLGSIGIMLTTIRDVSNSTNLLSLNAAIIAAQAKEHGKGFGVVASEIKELAELSAHSAKDIEGVLEEVHQQSERVSEAMAKGLDRMIKGSELTNQTRDSLEKINIGTQKTEEYVSQIVSITQEQSENCRLISAEIQRLVRALEMISDAAQEQSQQAKTISSSSEELNLETSKVRKSIRQQSNSSKHLQEITKNITEAVEKIIISIHEQKLSSQGIMESMSKISNVSENNLKTAREIEELINRTHNQREKLRVEVEKFKI